MNLRISATVAASLVVGNCAVAVAQTGWDAAVLGGGFAAHSPVSTNLNAYDDTFRSGQFGGIVGRHITRHLKVEIDASVTGSARQWFQRLVPVPGFNTLYPQSGEAHTSMRSFGASVTWQFLDNQWVHPFVTGGVVAEVERRTLQFQEQYYQVGDPRVPGNPRVVFPARHEGPETKTHWQPIVGTGVKAYVSERAFLRGEARVSLSNRHTVTFRAGVGVDF